jgi:hypothetical protein
MVGRLHSAYSREASGGGILAFNVLANWVWGDPYWKFVFLSKGLVEGWSKGHQSGWYERTRIMFYNKVSVAQILDHGLA